MKSMGFGRAELNGSVGFDHHEQPVVGVVPRESRPVWIDVADRRPLLHVLVHLAGNVGRAVETDPTYGGSGDEERCLPGPCDSDDLVSQEVGVDDERLRCGGEVDRSDSLAGMGRNGAV
jgi:hypothetical protein